MIKKIIAVSVIGIGSMILLSGCSGKETIPNPDADIEKKINSKRSKRGSNISHQYVVPYQMKLNPIVGSRSNDAKVVVDMGKVLKVWVAPYKQGLTLNSSHDVYTFVAAPQFVLGETVPHRQKGGSLFSPSNKLPFLITDKQLNVNSEEKEIRDEEIQKYVNGVYKARAVSPEQREEIVKEENSQSSEIIEFLENRRKLRAQSEGKK